MAKKMEILVLDATAWGLGAGEWTVAQLDKLVRQRYFLANTH